MLFGWLLAVTRLPPRGPSSGYSDGGQHLGDYANDSYSFLGEGTTIESEVGGSPLCVLSPLD